MPNTAPDSNPDFLTPLHVVVAVIVNEADQVLIAKRPEHLHQGGLWELPGGKLESGEVVVHALSRELDEELGITVEHALPLIRVRHSYPDRTVLLDVWRVDSFFGEVYGREGQSIAWVEKEQLPSYHFPVANIPVVTAARLPARYLVTPEPGDDFGLFITRLEQCLCAGVRLIQLRAKKLNYADYRVLVQQVIILAKRYQTKVLLNAGQEWVETPGADGVHITSTQLMSLESRPLPPQYWVAASCHNERELAQAVRIGVDFVVISPVLPTLSHPEYPALGWDQLTRLIEIAPFPVYALGGMSDKHLPLACSSGAQGIAAIRSIWGEWRESL